MSDITPEQRAMREALDWLVHLHNGVGRAGGDPEDSEWEAAIVAGMAALSAEAAPPAPTPGQCAVCRATYSQKGQHVGVPFSMVIAGRPICKRCVNAGKDARIAAEAVAAPAPTGAPADLSAIRHAWEAGFALCRSYGDNHSHFQGEQKERRWAGYVASVDAFWTPPAPASPPAERGETVHPPTSECPDAECMKCGARDCPHGEPLHYHHDGCPACYLVAP